MPDDKDHQRAFTALEFSERRKIVRAVNRGKPVEVRRHAPMAVSVARRQIRFWKYAWLLGPILGIVQLAVAPPEVALLNGLLGTAVLASLAWFWIRRAERSLVANLEIARGRVGPPRRSPSEEDTSPADTPSSEPVIAPRPPAPRRKKRRRR